MKKIKTVIKPSKNLKIKDNKKEIKNMKKEDKDDILESLYGFKPFPNAKKDVDSSIKEETKKSSGKFVSPYNFDIEEARKSYREISKSYNTINVKIPDPEPEDINNSDMEKINFDLPSYTSSFEVADDGMGNKTIKSTKTARPPMLENCKLCNTQMDLRVSTYYKFKIDKKNVGTSCDSCRPKLFTCVGCSALFKDEHWLKENHCHSCVESIPKNHNYLRVYNDKAESHFGSSITTRKSNLKYNSELSREIFGENDFRSYTVGAHGVSLKLFGVELEYMVRKNLGLGILSAFNVIRDSGLKAMLKRDGTLKDKDKNDNGFEVVSCPADKPYHYYAWEAFFDKIEKDDNIYCADYEPPAEGEERGTGCGCHIHISKDAMVHNESYGKNIGAYGLAGSKLQTFIHHPANRKFIEVIAGRPSNMFSDFVSKKGLQFKGDRIISGAADIIKVKMDHRTAVNFETSNKKTIEFRIFRSTKDRNELKKNIDFTDAICAFCRAGVASIEDIKDWIYFFEFVCKNRQDYPYLNQFFETDRDFLKLYNARFR